MPHFTVCTARQCGYSARTCRVLYRVPSSRTQLSVAPPGFHTHLPFFTMGVTESRQMPRRLPFTSMWTHPQAGAAILPLWFQALPHLCGHRAAAHSLHTDTTHSSWRMCRLTRRCAGSLCRCTLVVMETKHSQHTHTHPQCYHLVEMKCH